MVNKESIPFKSTLRNTSICEYACLLSQLTYKARSVVQDLDPSSDMTFLRVRSNEVEIMVAPDSDFKLIDIQSPKDSFLLPEHLLFFGMHFNMQNS